MQENDSTPIAAFAVWLAIQFAALALAALRFTLSSRYRVDAEHLAPAVLIATQTAAIALLFPALLQSQKWTIASILVIWPMGQIASVLADEPTARLVLSESYVSIWILTLYFWLKVFPKPSTRLYASAIAALITFGGPLLYYLRAEFVLESSQIEWKSLSGLGPMMGALAQIFAPAPASAWAMLLFLLGCGVIAAISHRKNFAM